ncbi:MAG: hypothetical protein WDN50_22265 [Bradyrhizobium sp.]
MRSPGTGGRVAAVIAPRRPRRTSTLAIRPRKISFIGVTGFSQLGGGALFVDPFAEGTDIVLSSIPASALACSLAPETPVATMRGYQKSEVNF